MKAFPLSNMTGLNQSGMDLRDYFAAKVMHALLSNWHDEPEWDANEQADIAYDIADAMLKARGE